VGPEVFLGEDLHHKPDGRRRTRSVCHPAWAPTACSGLAKVFSGQVQKGDKILKQLGLDIQRRHRLRAYRARCRLLTDIF